MFSKSTEYALRATIFIAQKASVTNKLGLAEIAKAIDSPKSFTAKILQQLSKDNKFIVSISGPRGGFYLPDETKKLPVSKVLELMGEDTKLTKCVLGLNQCSDVAPCPMHTRYKFIKKQLTDLFDKEDIEQLAQKVQSGESWVHNQ